MLNTLDNTAAWLCGFGFGMTTLGSCCCGHVKDASATVVWTKQILRIKPENFMLLRIKFGQFLGNLSQGTAGPCSLR